MIYEAVIGLEVHVQVKTASKIFTRVAAGYGHEPNTLTYPVVLALPGTLPVMNKAALDAVINAGQLYANDPSDANCLTYKARYEDYLDALRPYGNCSALTGQSRTDFNAALEAAEDDVATLCD